MQAQHEGVTDSSGNVFADRGLPDPEVRLAKSKLAFAIATLLEANGLTEADASARLGIDRADLSALTRGRLAGFSIEALFRHLNRLGQNVEIRIVPTNSDAASGKLIVAAERPA